MAKILVIEDDEDLQLLLAMNLRSAGFEVHQAFDGKKGCEMAASIKPDAILLDMMLPILNGAQVIRKLKADPALKDIPVIVATAYYSDVEFMESAMRAMGAVEYMRKPLKFNDLIRAVQAALGKR